MKEIIEAKQADENVAAALYKSAMNGSVQAQIFWLTNRQPDKWCKKPVATEELTQGCGIVLMPRRGDT